MDLLYRIYHIYQQSRGMLHHKRYHPVVCILILHMILGIADYPDLLRIQAYGPDIPYAGCTLAKQFILDGKYQ